MGNSTLKDDATALTEFGLNELGPAIALYLEDLLQTCGYFSSEREAKVLFAARAGVRIREALNVYLSRVGRTVPEEWEIFWVSRLMIAKGIWTDASEETAAILDSEFRYTPIDLALGCLTGTAIPLSDSNGDWPWTSSPSSVGTHLLKGESGSGPVLAHFAEQSELFRNATDALLGGRRAALIVDTGWSATSQKLLMKGRPDIDWWGCYFGLWNESGVPQAHWSRAKALVFESNSIDPRRPETAIVAHRHLIESLFEPTGPSIERYERRADGTIYPVGSKENLADAQTDRRDPMFAGVLGYLASAPEDPGLVRAAAATAWQGIFAKLVTPSRDFAMMFADQKRGADFGRSLSAPVLHRPDDRSTVSERIERSLWRPGQIALEYEPGMAVNVQRRLYGFPAGPLPMLPSPMMAYGVRPKVAIITRTMDRPAFLRRALYSVNAQRFRDFVHVVVCDGGDAALIGRIIQDAMIDHSKIILVDNVVNRGMEAASNIAIGAVDSDYIVIHDDDDSWQPQFLAEMVGFLESKTKSNYGGALCRCLRISESIDADGIQVHGVTIYRDDWMAPTLDQMRVANSFAPIAFLFRRDIYDRIGGYNENYPVLGDWDFNIRFLEVADIGFVKLELANYHHRDVGDTVSFGNTVVSGIDRHMEYEPIVKNAIARRLLRSGGDKPKVGHAAALSPE